MIYGHTPLTHHLFKVAVDDPIAAIPADRLKDDLTLKMTPLEITHQKSRCKLTALLRASVEILQQSR